MSSLHTQIADEWAEATEPGYGELMDELVLRAELMHAIAQLSDGRLSVRHGVPVQLVEALGRKALIGHSPVTHDNPRSPVEIYSLLMSRLRRSSTWVLARHSLGGYALTEPGVVDTFSPRYLGVLNAQTTVVDIAAMIEGG